MSEDPGLIETIRIARRWKPVIGLLSAVEDAGTTCTRMIAIRNLAAFCIRTAFNVDPYSKRLFWTYAMLCDLAQRDIRVRQFVEDICK